MKKAWGITIVLLLTLLVVYSSTEERDTNEKVGDLFGVEKETSAEGLSIAAQGMEVDKGVLDIEVTLPVSLVIDKDLEQVIAKAKNAGVSEVINNGDGSITYKISSTSEIMSQLDTTLLNSIEEMKNGENIVSIRDITFNQSLSEFTMVVDKDLYEKSYDRFVALGLGIAGLFIGILNGIDPDNNTVVIFVKDEATQEVFEKIVYPDDLEDEVLQGGI